MDCVRLTSAGTVAGLVGSCVWKCEYLRATRWQAVRIVHVEVRILQVEMSY